MESSCIQLQLLLYSQFTSRESTLSGADGQFSCSDSCQLDLFLNSNWELCFITLAVFVMRTICGWNWKENKTKLFQKMVTGSTSLTAVLHWSASRPLYDFKYIYYWLSAFHRIYPTTKARQKARYICNTDFYDSVTEGLRLIAESQTAVVQLIHCCYSFQFKNCWNNFAPRNTMLWPGAPDATSAATCSCQGNSAWLQHFPPHKVITQFTEFQTNVRVGIPGHFLHKKPQICLRRLRLPLIKRPMKKYLGLYHYCFSIGQTGEVGFRRFRNCFFMKEDKRNCN